MAYLKQLLTSVLVALSLLSLLAVSCQAIMTSITLKSGEEFNLSLNLVLEDRFWIEYKAIGGKTTGMQFSMSLPNGTVREFGTSGDFSYSFVCNVEGEYALNFVNTDQLEMLLTLEYEIQHYIFGMPQMLFMVMLIAVVSVAGVAVFIGLSRKPY
jgi:hypothetical protein